MFFIETSVKEIFGRNAAFLCQNINVFRARRLAVSKYPFQDCIARNVALGGNLSNKFRLVAPTQ